MKKNLRILLIILCLLVLPMNTVLAYEPYECDYGWKDLKISFEEGKQPTVTTSFIRKVASNHYFLYKTDKTIEPTNVIQNFDPNLYKSTTCPTKMKVCVVTNYSANLPTLSGEINLLGYSVTTIIDAVLEGFDNVLSLLPFVDIDFFGSLITEELKKELGANAYSPLYLNSRAFYIYTYREYEKSEFYGKTSGFYSELADIWIDNVDLICEDGVCSNWFFTLLNILFTNGKTYLDVMWKRITSTDPAIKAIGYRDIECKTVNLPESSEHESVDINCTFMTTGLNQYESYIEDYKSCNDSSCKSSKIKNIHNFEKTLKVKCNAVLSNYYYNDDEKDCIKSCLSLNDQLNELRKGTDLYEDLSKSNNANCSLSSRLVAWIMKFINWMRYIIPVLLIILSVLDYIKAIASDSEDEVKKVTSKFVKRLIVAVCIFLVPLALQFLLGIFGINANNFCL